MKRHELVRYLRAQGCEELREGAKHTVWWNPEAKKTSTVLRHTEIKDLLADKICKDLEVPTKR